MRRALAIIVFLLGYGLNATAQKNLVLNGDFEQYKHCPLSNDDIGASRYWSGIDSLFIGSLSCIPEYCHVCADSPNDLTSVPASIQYWQWPHSGSGMATSLVYRNDRPYSGIRECLQGRLSRRLTVGKSYCLSFYVSLCEFSRWAIKDISAYLDNGSIDTASECWRPQSRYSPQVTNQGGVISDTTRWTKIEGSFVANGTEQFITMGNFKDNAATTKLSLPLNSYSNYFFTDTASAYLIDDVSVVETGTKADAGLDKHIGYGDSVYIGLPSSEVVWNSWSILGSSTVIGEGPGIWVKPRTTTSYVVTQTLCGTTTKDTVRVEVWAAGITSISGQSQQYRLSPNPAKDVLFVSQLLAGSQPVNAALYEASGRKLYSTSIRFDAGSSHLDVSNLPQGLYLLRITESNGNGAALRFVKN